MKINILARIRTGKKFKYISAFVAFSVLSQCFFPTVALALTSGPAQEEFASFEPATTTDMVDLYSGDFNYNIPLLSVPGPNGGYPINLAYHSGVGMEQEASWVGLGWNINVGAINRQLRGLPDDFNGSDGDKVTQKMNLKKNTTVLLDIDGKKHVKKFGVPDDKPNMVNYQVYYNTYKGLGSRIVANVTREISYGAASGGVGLGLSYDSQQGIGIEPNFTLGGQYNGKGVNFQAGLSYNSRQGVQQFSFASGISSSKNGYVIHKARDGKQMKEYVAAMGYKGSASISYSTSHAVPTVSIPMRTDSYPFDIKLSNEFTKKTYGVFRYQMPLAWKGSVSVSKVANNGEASTPAFGYLYTSEASNDDMRDFQRAPIEYSDKIPNLAPSSFTYDLYTQTGQGSGSMFRPYYTSVGRLATPNRKSTESQSRFNLELSVGSDLLVTSTTDIHVGAGYTDVDGRSTSGAWEEDNNLSSTLGFSDGRDGAIGYENYYFKTYGEKSGMLLSDEEIESKWGGDRAIRVKLNKIGSWPNKRFEASSDFVYGATTSSLFTAGDDQKFGKQRQPRASNIEILTDEQALKYGGQQAQFGSTNGVPNKTFTHGKKISEISVLQSDGMRYTYGLPAYNLTQTDAVFAVNGNGATTTKHANNNIDIPTKNNDQEIDPYGGQGNDEYLNETTMSTPYAHSWLLTSVVSSDYIDMTGNGPSEDDYGYWVKFNYEKSVNNYKWRVPYTGATYIEGNRGDYSDDKASFSYGEKEIYFLNSIETKTHIAYFNTTNRFDGLEAYRKLANYYDNSTRRGMKALTSISLYTKEARTDHLYPPIKVVNFCYSYKLCQGTRNSDANRGAKLTLDKVYFTYQRSSRGKLSAYKFSYGDALSPENPTYNLDNMDRWGNFKNNYANYVDGHTNRYPFLDFPYTEQEHGRLTNVDKWTLKQIDLPTGGSIKIKYESDDYAYVESKRAAHMFDIVSIGEEPGTVPNRTDETTTIDATETPDGTGGYRIYFRLEENVAGMTAAARNAYIARHVEDVSKMYFKVYAELTPGHYDYVTGYADVMGSGWLREDIGYVTIRAVDLKKHSIQGQSVNPFTKAAIQHLRISRPELIFDKGLGDDDPLAQILNLIGAVGPLINDLMSMVQGFNTFAYMKNYGQKIQLNGRSVIRLTDPDGIKYGGGLRVAQLSISDNWDASNQEISSTSTGAKEYGQKYHYTINEGGRTISSGVAYEPVIGNDENALHTPVEYEQSTLLGTTSNMYLNKPILEEYYPGASVGYRKVTVESLAPDQADLSDNKQIDGSLKIEKTTAPQTIYEFYTPKDFPVICDETDLSSDPAVINPIIIPGVYSSFSKRKARSQGYSVILNDMAGKMKSVTQRTSSTSTNPDGALISREEYVYNTETPYSETKVNKLSDKVQVLTIGSDHLPKYQPGVIGQSHDVFIDDNENKYESKGYGGDLNLELQILTTAPYVIPFIIPMPYASVAEASMRTSVTMKVIHRSGILKQVITTTGESIVTKESMAFDLETGKPLLTRVTNEFKDPVYQFAYPAHWYYENMGGAYKNYGLVVSNLNSNATVANGGLVTTNISATTYLNKGDEVLVNNSFKAHIYDLGSNFVKLINRNGGYVVANVTSLKVIASGKKNLLDAEAGQLIAKGISDFSQPNPTTFSFSSIVDAKAVHYKNHWDVVCDRCGTHNGQTGTPYNTYLTGEDGIWRPAGSYVYKTNRLYTNDKSRTDGTYADFVPFKWYDIINKDPKWINANSMTLYSPTGFELENKDALGNYSSAMYGYKQSLTTAVAKNAQSKEVAFDGFEEYYYDECLDHHLNFEPFKTKMTRDESHSGSISIRLKPGEKVQVETIMLDCHR